MEKSKPSTLEPNVGSTWEHLEDFVREHVQHFIQALLEEEVTELLGERSQPDERLSMQLLGIGMAMASPDA